MVTYTWVWRVHQLGRVPRPLSAERIIWASLPWFRRTPPVHSWMSAELALSLKMNWVYPDLVFEYTLLLDQFHIQTIEQWHFIQAVTVLYKVIHNRIDCLDLFNKISSLYQGFVGAWMETLIVKEHTLIYSVRPQYSECVATWTKCLTLTCITCLWGLWKSYFTY